MQSNYFEKSCFEQKNALSRFALILFKLVDFQEKNKLKCTKFDFGWGSAPDPAGGAYSAPSDPIAGYKGDYF